METIQIDVGEIANAKIKELTKKLAASERKVAKLAAEVSSLKKTHKEVESALAAIKSFAADLPSWEDW